MLVLTRRLGEKVKIGDDVIISIISVKGNSVRIGFKAPKQVIIVREELEKSNKQEEKK